MKSLYVLYWICGDVKYPTYAYSKRKYAKEELKVLGYKKIKKNLYGNDRDDNEVRCEILEVMGLVR